MKRRELIKSLVFLPIAGNIFEKTPVSNASLSEENLLAS
jgi:hypothetical protein